MGAETCCFSDLNLQSSGKRLDFSWHKTVLSFGCQVPRYLLLHNPYTWSCYLQPRSELCHFMVLQSRRQATQQMNTSWAHPLEIIAMLNYNLGEVKSHPSSFTNTLLSLLLIKHLTWGDFRWTQVQINLVSSSIKNMFCSRRPQACRKCVGVTDCQTWLWSCIFQLRSRRSRCPWRLTRPRYWAVLREGYDGNKPVAAQPKYFLFQCTTECTLICSSFFSFLFCQR